MTQILMELFYVQLSYRSEQHALGGHSARLMKPSFVCTVCLCCGLILTIIQMHVSCAAFKMNGLICNLVCF